MLALHIHGSQLTLSNTHAFHYVETSEQACRPILLGLRHHVWDYSRDGSNLHHRRVRLASPGRRMRFAYVLILGITWGTEWSRWIQTGQMFLVHFFVSRNFFGSTVFRCSRASADWRPMSTYRGWASYTHELVTLPWILGVGFGCINCKDTLRDAAYVVYLVSVWS